MNTASSSASSVAINDSSMAVDEGYLQLIQNLLYISIEYYNAYR